MDPDQVPNTYLSYGPDCKGIAAYDLARCIKSRPAQVYTNRVPEGFASVSLSKDNDKVLAFGDVKMTSSNPFSNPINVEVTGLLPDQPNGAAIGNYPLDAYVWSMDTSLLHLTGNLAADPSPTR